MLLNSLLNIQKEVEDEYLIDYLTTFKRRKANNSTTYTDTKVFFHVWVTLRRRKTTKQNIRMPSCYAQHQVIQN